MLRQVILVRQHLMRELASFSVENRIEEVGRLQQRLAELWEVNGLPPADEYAAAVVLDEALSNVIRHGGISGQPHQIVVRFLLDGSIFQLDIEDNGRPFDPFQSAPAPNLSSNLKDRRPGGLGVYLVRTLFDDVHYEYSQKRNLLRLRKHLTYNDASGARAN